MKNLNILIASLLLCFADTGSAGSTLTDSQVLPAGTAQKGEVGAATERNEDCAVKYGTRNMEGTAATAHWATTEEVDYMLRNGVPMDHFRTHITIRSVATRYRPNGTPYDPYLGAVSNKPTDFPGAIIWKEHQKYFAARASEQVEPLCVWSAIKR